MLMTPMTPKVMARPMAASSSTEPSESPYQRFCTRVPQRQTVLDLGAGRARGRVHVGRQVGRQPVEQAERILVAAVADDGDRRDLVGRARIRVGRG